MFLLLPNFKTPLAFLCLILAFSLLIRSTNANNYNPDTIPCDSLFGCQICTTNLTSYTNSTDNSTQTAATNDPKSLPTFCQQCYLGYDLNIKNNTCSYNSSICSEKSGWACNISNCLLEQPLNSFNNTDINNSTTTHEVNSTLSSRCSSCVLPYSLNTDFACSVYCKFTESNVTDINLCKPVCYQSHCKLCSESNSYICNICDKGKFLYYGICIDSCPTTTYILNNECFDCNPECETCTNKNACSSCKIQSDNQIQLPLCKCPPETSFYSSKCLKECPYLYASTDQVCNRICPGGQFPIISQDQQFKCDWISSSSSDFCSQNLKYLSQQLSIDFQKHQDSIYSIVISIKESPPACYSYALKGLNQYYLQQQEINFDGQSTNVRYFLNSTEILNPDNVQCSKKACYLYFQILWKGYISLTFKVTLGVSISGNLQNALTYNSQYENLNVACENCQIPQTQMISSELSLTCSVDQRCTNESIFTTINSPIIITQRITDLDLKNSIVLPHSLKLTYLDLSTNYLVETYIKDYKYVNSIPGNITYRFYAAPVQNAQLTVTSVVQNANVTRILGDVNEDSRMNNIEEQNDKDIMKYPSMVIQLTVQEEENFEKSWINMTIVVITSTVAFLFLVLNAAGVIFKFKICEKKLKMNDLELNRIQDIQQLNDEMKRQIKAQELFNHFDSQSSVVIDTQEQKQ